MLIVMEKMMKVALEKLTSFLVFNCVFLLACFNIPGKNRLGPTVQDKTAGAPSLWCLSGIKV